MLTRSIQVTVALAFCLAAFAVETQASTPKARCLGAMSGDLRADEEISALFADGRPSRASFRQLYADMLEKNLDIGEAISVLERIPNTFTEGIHVASDARHPLVIEIRKRLIGLGLSTSGTPFLDYDALAVFEGLWQSVRRPLTASERDRLRKVITAEFEETASVGTDLNDRVAIGILKKAVVDLVREYDQRLADEFLLENESSGWFRWPRFGRSPEEGVGTELRRRFIRRIDAIAQSRILLNYLAKNSLTGTELVYILERMTLEANAGLRPESSLDLLPTSVRSRPSLERMSHRHDVLYPFPHLITIQALTQLKDGTISRRQADAVQKRIEKVRGLKAIDSAHQRTVDELMKIIDDLAAGVLKVSRT